MNAVKSFEKAAKTQKRAQEARIAYTFQVFITPGLINQASLINNSFAYELCGKFSASSAELKFLNSLLKLHHRAIKEYVEEEEPCHVVALIPYEN